MCLFFLSANLLAIQKYYHIEESNSSAGILQTVFIISYMVMCPIFGYLGDRYSRKLVMSFGVLFWAFMTFLCSFVPDDVSINGFLWKFNHLISWIRWGRVVLWPSIAKDVEKYCSWVHQNQFTCKTSQFGGIFVVQIGIWHHYLE